MSTAINTIVVVVVLTNIMLFVVEHMGYIGSTFYGIH